jgi:hypothetical protein
VISPLDLERLRVAKSLLENPSLAAKCSSALGTPIEKAFALLPANWKSFVGDATQRAIQIALDAALLTVDHGQAGAANDWWHKIAIAVSGATGGAFGLAALPVELPISTTIILRSIADIARSEGENLQDPTAKFQCLQILAMGGRSKNDDSAEIGYFAMRQALASAVSEAATYFAQKGIAQEGAPALVRLITTVATRFSITVSEKVAAQAVPLLGGVGGAIVNTLFIDHFQNMARGHFTVRSLERVYGAEAVKLAYDELQPSAAIAQGSE